MKNPETPSFESLVPADVLQTLDEIRAADVLAEQSDAPKNAEDILASIDNPEARENAENLLKDFGSVPVKSEVIPNDPFSEPPKVPTTPLPKTHKVTTLAVKTETAPTNVIEPTDRLVARAANSYRVRRINNREARQSKATAREELKNRSQKIESNVAVTKAQEAFDEAEQNMQRAKEALSRDARRERAKNIYDARVDTLRAHFTKDGVLDEKRFGAALKGLERTSKKAAKIQSRAEYNSSVRTYEARATTLGLAEKRRREEIKSLRWYRNTRFNGANRQGIRYNGYISPEASTSGIVDIKKARKEAAKKRRDQQNARTKAAHADAKKKAQTRKPSTTTPIKKAA